MGRLATKPSPVKRVPKSEVRFCDACGHSKMDGNPIAHAKWKIATPSGNLYFCGSHYRKHAQRLAEHGYDILDLTGDSVGV